MYMNHSLTLYLYSNVTFFFLVIPDENFGRLEETNKIDSDDEKLFASLIQLQESLKAKTNKEV